MPAGARRPGRSRQLKVVDRNSRQAPGRITAKCPVQTGGCRARRTISDSPPRVTVFNFTECADRPEVDVQYSTQSSARDPAHSGHCFSRPRNAGGYGGFRTTAPPPDTRHAPEDSVLIPAPGGCAGPPPVPVTPLGEAGYGVLGPAWSDNCHHWRKAAIVLSLGSGGNS